MGRVRIPVPDGTVFARWTTVGEDAEYKKVRRMKCVCDCGNTAEVSLGVLRSGKSTQCRDCGLRDRLSNPKLGAVVKHRLYSTWLSMRRRCYSEYNWKYERYGGRGIRICDRWRESFWDFVSDMGDKPSKNHSIDRIDNDGDYTPENCRWATRRVQQMNRGLPSNNKSGVLGVSRSASRGCWVAAFAITSTKYIRRQFSCRKYGEALALEMAKQQRVEWEEGYGLYLKGQGYE